MIDIYILQELQLTDDAYEVQIWTALKAVAV